MLRPIRQALSALRARLVGSRRASTVSEGRVVATDGGRVVVPLSDRTSVRGQLERFAGSAFQESSDGSLACAFPGVTHFTVLPDGRVDTGMPLHSFKGPADRLVFDHERGEITVELDTEEETLSYTFRRP
jgi:hypothetical protein